MADPQKIVIPQLVMVIALHFLAAIGLFLITPQALLAFIIAHILVGGFGTSLGFHRFLAHKSFDAHPAVAHLICLLGTLAFQKGPLTWVGFHRAHHQRENEIGDPHAASRGFWWSHMLWIFHIGPNGYHSRKIRPAMKDVIDQKFLIFLDKHHALINVGSWLILWAVFDLSVAIWAGPVRTVVLWHSTWLVNSICHETGLKGATSLNRQWVAWITYGEGLHKNHHQHQRAAKYSNKLGQFDPGYWILTGLHGLGLVRNLNRYQPR